MGKFLTYCKQDGFYNALKYASSSLTSFFYRKSETEFVKIDLTAKPLAPDIENFEINNITKDKFSQLDFPRLKYQPCEKWFEIGSELYVGFYEGVPATYSWIHYAYHDMGDLGIFELNEDECWVGPTFVDNKFRGKGLNKIQMLQNFKDANATIAFGSFNTQNVSSKKSCLKVGFEIYGKAICTKILLSKRIKIEGELLKNHLK